jgi:hypothetical protein
MKMPSTLTHIVLIAAVCLHHAQAAGSMPRPKVSIGVNSDARDSSLGGIEPKVSWASSSKLGAYDLEVCYFVVVLHMCTQSWRDVDLVHRSFYNCYRFVV